MRAIFRAILIFSIALPAALAQEAPDSGQATATSEAVIEGSVTNKLSGSPVKEAHVMFTRLPQAGEQASESYAESDAAGHYSARLAAGQYRIWVDRPGFSRLSYGASSTLGVGKTVTVMPGQQLTDISFRLAPLAAISGHIVDEDGDPVQGAGVEVLKFTYGTGRRVLTAMSGVTSDDRGEYRAFNLPPGRYFLLVTRPPAALPLGPGSGLLIPDMREAYAPLYYPGVLDFNEASPLVLAEGAEVPDTDIRLQRVRVMTLRGHLVSPVQNFADTQPQVMLAARGSGSLGKFPNAVIDRLSGRFEFHNVSPGSYMLVAWQLYRGRALSGRMPVEVTSGGHPENLALPLGPGYEISGSVELAGAAPDALKGTRVVLTDAEGLAPGAQPSAPVEAGGVFRLSGIAAGAWYVSLSPAPKGSWLKSVVLDGREAPGGLLELAGSTQPSLRILLSATGAQFSGIVTRDGQPTHATVVLVPAKDELRSSAANYPTISTGEDGAFSLSGIRPGSYKAFAFEDIEPYAWLDPDFIKAVDQLGVDLTLNESDNLRQQIVCIPGDSLQLAP